ncbi:hypothetical protein ACFLYO_07335 [Chloroflexota bacterium]
MRKLLVVLLLSVLVLSACGGGEPAVEVPPSPTPDIGPPPDDLPTHDLEPGGYRLSAEGFLTGDESEVFVSASSPGVKYTPSVMFLMGLGTNTAGDAGLALKASVATEAEPDRPLGLTIALQFDPDIDPGEYTIGNGVSARGSVPTYGIFTATEGTVMFDFVNRLAANGSFELTLTSVEDHTITVNGAFHNIAFTPEPEHALQVTGAVEMASSDSLGRSAIGTGVTSMMGLANADGQYGEVRLVFSYDATPGEYDAADDTGLAYAGDIMLGDEEVTAVTGTITLTESTPHFSGTVDLTVETSAGPSTITGSFSYYSAARP